MPNNVYASGKGNLIEPPYSSFNDQWDQPVNSNFGLIGALVGGVTEIDATTFTAAAPSKTLVFLTYEDDSTPWDVALAGQNLCINVKGVLSTNANIYIPKNVGGFWFINNATSGNFTLTVRTTAGTGTSVTPLQGYMSIIYSDGTNVIFADQGTVKSDVVPVATDTVNGIVTQGLLKGNCVNLNDQAKIPYQADKVIIATTDPDPAQGYQNWVWYKTA